MTANRMKDAADTAALKAEPMIRKAKSAAITAAKKAEPFVECVKTAGKQIAEGYVPEVYVQYASRQYDCMLLAERCREDFEAKYHESRIRSCKLYIKPEDGMVYYVINDIEDRLPL